MISNSGHDENGRYSGGKAGDQTGGEWQIRTWYNRPWNCVLRYPDRKVGDLIADLSRQAALNDYIGYDQGQRSTYWEALKKAKYYPSKIKILCESDCSAGVLANVKAAGYILGIKALEDVAPDGWTGSMRVQLTAAGFKLLTASKYLTSDNYLLPGDILLNDRSHTAVNLDTGKYAGNVPDVKAEKIKTGQKWFNTYYGDFLIRTFGELLEVDGVYGPKSRAAALAIWKDVCNRLYKTKTKVSSKKFGPACVKAAATCAEVKYGDDGTIPFICQFLLAAKGFYTGLMDAKCGRDLCVSIQAYEKANGLDVDSSDPLKCSAGKQVWTKLFEEVK